MIQLLDGIMSTRPDAKILAKGVCLPVHMCESSDELWEIVSARDFVKHNGERRMSLVIEVVI